MSLIFEKKCRYVEMAETRVYSKKIPGREEIHICLELNENGSILSSQVSGLGSLDFLLELAKLRSQLVGKIQDVIIPELAGKSGDLLLRAAVLNLKGEWNPPYSENIMCHCRAVPTATIEQALIIGARSVSDIMRMTSASTACGTCMPDVAALLDYWVKTN